MWCKKKRLGHVVQFLMLWITIKEVLKGFWVKVGF